MAKIPILSVYDENGNKIDIPAIRGANGITPHIGTNGNWFLGETDTGIKAQGENGNNYVLTEADKTQIAEQAASMADVPTKTSDLTNDSGFITVIPSEYVTETELNNKGYLTQHQDLSSYAKKSDIPTVPVQSVNGKTGAVQLSASDVNALPSSTKIPAKISELTNDSGFITGYTESDPTVPSWAKASTKPSYTKSEVGLGNVDNVKQYSTSNPPPYPVTAVNGKTGAVTLGAADVGAATSQQFAELSREIADLENKIPEGGVTQETDPTVPAWAKEPKKPTYTASEVGADASGTAESKVSAHNTSDAAHNDIRLLITGLTNRLNALANSTDEDLDQLAEIVAYIKANKSLIDSVTTDKVSVTDIIDNLTTSVSNKPLSAKMGVELKKLIDAIKIPTTLPASDVYDWAKAATKPRYTASEVGALPASTKIPAKTSDLTNDSGFVADSQVYAKGETYSQTEVDSLIDALERRLEAVADSDDVTLDQLSEIVAYIKANKSLIDSITTSKISVSDIVDNLATGDSKKPLSAAQGKALKALYDAIPAWAKASSKPSYSKSEVGLGNVDNVKQYSENNPPPYPVKSVNGKTGAVTLGAADVGAATTEQFEQLSKEISDQQTEISKAGNEVYILKTGETVDDAPDGVKEIIDPNAENVTIDFGQFAKKEDVNDLSKEIADLETEVDNLKENGTGATVDENAVVHNAVGATYPPAQKPAATEFDGYDIDILDSTADAVYTYIDNVVSGKETVTKEIMGKDASGKYDIARYIYANREYCAWQKENYPKMYAWKNGSAVRYSTSVSPRIGDRVYSVPYVQATGTQVVTTPAKAVIIKGYRYSSSGGGYKQESGVSSLIIPINVPIAISSESPKTLVLNGMTAHSVRDTTYYGDTPTDYPYTGVRTTSDNINLSVYGIKAGVWYLVMFINYTGASGEYDGVSLTYNGITIYADAYDDPADASKASHESSRTEITETAGTPVTAVSATNHSRTVDGVEYVRYAAGDVMPTVLYTAVGDSRNNEATITDGGITYHRYPIGDLGANRKKLTPVFVYANEHGVIKDIVANENHEGKIPALVAARLMRDMASGAQEKNPLYQYVRDNCMLIVIPVANPYGFNYNLTDDNNGNSGYYNADMVNINRNYDTPGWDAFKAANPTAATGAYPGSAVETQYVMNTISESGAVVAMSLHGYPSGNNKCAYQGQNPGNVVYDADKIAKINAFLQSNWGYGLADYDSEPLLNTPDKTAKSPSYITQCGAYGGIVEMSPDDNRTSGLKHEANQHVCENAYAQVLNLAAMWLSDYMES